MRFSGGNGILTFGKLKVLFCMHCTPMACEFWYVMTSTSIGRPPRMMTCGSRSLPMAFTNPRLTPLYFPRSGKEVHRRCREGNTEAPLKRNPAKQRTNILRTFLGAGIVARRLRKSWTDGIFPILSRRKPARLQSSLATPPPPPCFTAGAPSARMRPSMPSQFRSLTSSYPAAMTWRVPPRPTAGFRRNLFPIVLENVRSPFF